MNINIEKITNGYVVTIEGKKTFCDVPEAICGLTSEWVLETCKKLDDLKPLSKSAQDLATAIELARAQAQMREEILKQSGQTYIGTPTWPATVSCTG